MPDALFMLTLEPVLLIDEHGRLQRCTPSARALLAREPVLLSQLSSRLRAGALSAAGGFALPRPGRLPLTLRIAHEGEFGTLVLLRDPEAVHADADLLRQLFGLTSAEARVAAALARGGTTADVARQTGVQQNTVRAHVKRLLQKTGTADRTQLVSLLLRSAAIVDHRGLADGALAPPVHPRVSRGGACDA